MAAPLHLGTQVFDDALRDLDLFLRQARDAAGRLAEAREREVDGGWRFRHTPAVHKQPDTQIKGITPCESWLSTLPLSKETTQGRIWAGRRSPLEPLQKNPGDSLPSITPHGTPTVSPPAVAPEEEEEEEEKAIAPSKRDARSMSDVTVGQSWSHSQSISQCTADPLESRDSSLSRTEESQLPHAPSRVLLFKVRKDWLRFSNTELEMYMPGYQPGVKLHSTRSQGYFALSSRTFRHRVSLGNGNGLLNADEVRRGRMAQKSGAFLKALAYVMDPNKRLRLAWNIPALLFIIYDTVTVPLQAFHIEDDPTFMAMFRFVEWMATVFWTLDMIVSMRTGYYNGTVLEMRPRKIAVRYLKTWFVVDFPLIVMEWVARFATVLNTASVVRVTRIFRIVRCVRLLRLAKLQAIWNFIEARIASSITLLFFSIGKMLLAFVVFVHAITCAWYAIGQATRNGWTSYEPPIENHFAFWYFASCRWTLAQINGRTDMNERRNMLERMYTCLIAVCFAVIFMAVFLSSVTTTMIELSTLSEERNASKRGMNAYLDHEKLSVKLVANIRRHLAAKVSLQCLVNEKARERLVLSQIPEHLQYDLLYEVRAPVLRWHSFFHAVEGESLPVMRCLCFAALRPLLAHRCEEVFDQGNACSRMFFLDTGKCVYEQFDRVHESDAPRSHVSPAAAVDGAGKRKTKRQHRITKLEGTEGHRDHSIRRSSFTLMTHSSSCTSQSSREEEWEAIWKVKPGMWVSEAALWMEWENQGQLAAEGDSCLYTIEADDLVLALRDYKDGFAMAAIYGRTFVEELKIQSELSDLLHVSLHRSGNDTSASI